MPKNKILELANALSWNGPRPMAEKTKLIREAVEQVVASGTKQEKQEQRAYDQALIETF